MAKHLHEALADVNITSRPGTIAGKRALIQFGSIELGEFDAAEGWALVHRLEGSPVECPVAAEG